MTTIEKDFGLKDVNKIARELLPFINEARIVTFSGPLGAGKTTLICSLAKALGIKDRVTSPTFAYLAIYKLPDDEFQRQQLEARQYVADYISEVTEARLGDYIL